MLVLWIIMLLFGILITIKAEKAADIWRSTEFSTNTSDGKRQRQLVRRSGFWRIIGVIMVVLSIFLISGGDDLFVSKSTEAILESTPDRNDIIK